MTDVAANADLGVRHLRPDDLERVIAIDAAHVGHARRHFFAKRLAAETAQPDDFIHVGLDRDGSLAGFAIARVLRGEFGLEQATAILDAVGVDPQVREQGVGKALLDGLVEVMRNTGVGALQSQAPWTNQGLLRFFEAAGFQLAPRLALERSVATPLAEQVEV